VKIGVVGTGFGQRVVAPVFAATAGCEVVDVVSAREEGQVRALVQRADLDLVSIHSPPYLHAPHVRVALEAGKAVLCDKPFTLGPEEAEALEAEALSAGSVALCNFEFRYAPARVRLRDLVRDGTLGTIERVQIVHLSAGTRSPLRTYGWLFDRGQGGGWIGAWGSHAIDGLRWMFGAEVVDLAAVLRIDVPERTDRSGARQRCTAEDGFSAVVTLMGGTTVTIDSGFAAAANIAPRFTIFGSDAVAELTGETRITLRRSDGTRDVVDVDDGDAQDAHLVPMRRFAEVVRDSVTAGTVSADAPTFADGRACDEVLARLRSCPFVPVPAARPTA
jgi:predicted dehydrogenase